MQMFDCLTHPNHTLETIHVDGCPAKHICTQQTRWAFSTSWPAPVAIATIRPANNMNAAHTSASGFAVSRSRSRVINTFTHTQAFVRARMRALSHTRNGKKKCCCRDDSKTMHRILVRVVCSTCVCLCVFLHVCLWCVSATVWLKCDVELLKWAQMHLAQC